MLDLSAIEEDKAYDDEIALSASATFPSTLDPNI